jgi:hypothetical protein
MKRKPQAVEVVHVVTTERTAKRWKFLRLFWRLPAFAGALTAFGGYIAEDETVFLYGLGLMLFGACIGLFAQIGAWWQHS